MAKAGVREKGVVASVKEATDYEVWAKAPEDAATLYSEHSYFVQVEQAHLMLPAPSPFPPSAAVRACSSAVDQRPSGAPVLRSRLPDELLARELEVLSRGRLCSQVYT